MGRLDMGRLDMSRLNMGRLNMGRRTWAGRTGCPAFAGHDKKGSRSRRAAHAFPAKIFFTISIARRSKVIDASSVRNAACEVNVTFAICASG